MVHQVHLFSPAAQEHGDARPQRNYWNLEFTPARRHFAKVAEIRDFLATLCFPCRKLKQIGIEVEEPDLSFLCVSGKPIFGRVDDALSENIDSVNKAWIDL